MRLIIVTRKYQDAFGETGGYKPRVRKPKPPKPDVEVNQLSLDFGKGVAWKN